MHQDWINPVAKAIWYIESHLDEQDGLEAIADACGVSRFHLVRAFAAATGQSLMRYRRNRRLSEAARGLAGGANSITEVAFSAGYASHEAFTRAFRDRFGMTPEACRKRGDLSHVTLTEALRMEPATAAPIEPERITAFGPILLAGLAGRYRMDDLTGIPGQWQRFNAGAATIAHRIGDAAYGVCYNVDDEGNMDYLCGFEVAHYSDQPAKTERLQLPQATFAVFAHRAHVASIGATWRAIWETWLPASGRSVLEAPTFELYGPRFDPVTGLGGFEIFVPLKP